MGVRLNEQTGKFDNSELVDLLENGEAPAVSEPFFVFERLPTLTLLVQYRDTQAVPTTRRMDTRRIIGWVM